MQKKEVEYEDKWKKKALDENELDRLADVALNQIDEMKYDTEMKENGINKILKFGIAFLEKKVRVKLK